MKVVGLTGGIGAGKSAAAEILASFGAVVIDADRVGHAVYAPGTPGFTQVVDAFGAEVVGEDGAIDRSRLGPLVFADPTALARLNAIVHPLIRRAIATQLRDVESAGEVSAAVVEAAILVEAGWHELVDEIWVVVAEPERVIERLGSQRGLRREEVEARMARQLSNAERARAAEVVIENRGTLDDLRAALDRVWTSRVVGDSPR